MQVTRTGNLRAGINGLGAFQSRLPCVRPGQWQLLAVTWDLGTRTARFSCDGKQVATVRHQNGAPSIPGIAPQFGNCRIGSWGDRPVGNAREYRDFKGRIDEVMIFNRALSDEELAALYTSGRP